MRTFVMGDIHGSHKAMLQCFDRSGFDFSEDRLIQLGDVVDGQPDVFECVETLLELDRLIAIKGNHEVWFADFIETDFHPAYFSHGGLLMAISYMGKANLGKRNYKSTGYGYKTALTRFDIPKSHRDFFTKEQRLYFIDNDNRCFVHGGFNRSLPFIGQKEETYYWNRGLWEGAIEHALLKKEGKIVDDYAILEPFSLIFIGHTPTTNIGTDHPVFLGRMINLDTGAGHGGRLTIMDVDTKEYWQSDLIADLYKKC